MSNQYADSFGQHSGRPTTKVELFFSAQSLINKDTFSKSDPQLFLYSTTNGVETLLGKTETIQDNLNPEFTKSIPVPYYFEEVQRLRIALYDIDDPKGGVDKQVEIELSELVSRYKANMPLIHPTRRKAGTITVTTQEVGDTNSTAVFHVGAVKLDKKDLFGKSDPFLQISRQEPDGSFTSVHRTEYIRKTLTPTWLPFEIPMHKLNSGELERPLRFQVYDWNKSGKMDFIGEFTASFIEVSNQTAWPLINPKKATKRSYVHSGELRFIRAQARREHSFFEYLSGGLNMNLTIAIDFTASNGNAQSPQSLHYIKPDGRNEYLDAIYSVGSVLAHYDSDGMIAAHGYGAKLPPNGQVSHCFPLALDLRYEELLGVQGVIDAYRVALQRVQLYGPTNFAPVLQASIAAASPDANPQAHSNQPLQYHVLMIITDGEITDMSQTIQEVVTASSLPISIVIVGVGQANFDKMDILDADDAPLSHAGRTQERDIVQFVPFRDLAGDPHRLAQTTLHELPGQVTSFFKARNVAPRPPRQQPVQIQIQINQ